MKFRKRFRLYLTGVLIGSLFVVVVFNERLSLLTDWLPNNRILDRLQQTDAVYSEEGECYMNCFEIDTVQVNSIKKDGDVMFRLSDTHSEPKVYVVDGKDELKDVRLTFSANDSSSVLIKAEIKNQIRQCPCDV